MQVALSVRTQLRDSITVFTIGWKLSTASANGCLQQRRLG
jgi:hypothetical protein